MKHAVGSHRVGVNATHDSLGRSTGYVYSKNGATQQTVTTGYGTDGRINSAGFLHGGAEKQFSYEYLPGTHLLQELTLPSNMTLTQSYEPQRDLLTDMCYKRSNTTVAERTYTYDALGRPLTRTTARNGQTVTDSFGYNNRSELTTATVNNGSYAYEYDNIGNRKTSQEVTEEVTGYTANELNQYTSISVDGDIDFQPEYDADGNQTRVKTSTGIWAVIYNAENRPTDFYKIDESGSTTVKCTYDHMGRRATRLVTVNGNVTLHQRYIYRGYLQIACIDLTRAAHPALWYITWDPTQPVATRPLAIQLNGTWYTYGWDLTKNICELYGQHGYIRTAYTYTPYGQVTAEGDVEQSPRGLGGGLDKPRSEFAPQGRAGNGVPASQPIQWSSEFNDTELGLVYYNYRHYNPVEGRWTGRDRIEISNNLLDYTSNAPINAYDELGLSFTELFTQNSPECCKACNNYLKEKKKIYKSEINKILEKGCKIEFVCKTFFTNSNGGTRRTDFPLNPFSRISIKVSINCKVGATQDLNAPEDTFGHELMHAMDHCDGKLNGSCESNICSEIKAYSVGGCKNLKGTELINCLKRRVAGSADNMCWFLSKEDIAEKVPSMITRCLK